MTQAGNCPCHGFHTNLTCRGMRGWFHLLKAVNENLTNTQQQISRLDTHQLSHQGYHTHRYQHHCYVD